MANKEAFKEFVRKNPRLMKYVKDGSMTWQNFYEIYDLYGEKEETWKEYLGNANMESRASTDALAAAASGFGLADVMNFVKNIDLNSVQNGVSSLQRVISVLQDFSNKDSSKTKEEYKPRPIYKHFED